MVTNIAIVKPKVYTGMSQMEEFAEDFRKETRMMLEKVAFENNIPVEQLKFTVDSTGVVNIQSMTEEEMIEMDAQRIVEKKISAVRKMRRWGNG